MLAAGKDVTMTEADRVLAARIAAHARWAKTPDRSAATAKARQAQMDRFERQVEAAYPDLPPEARSKLAESAKRAHYTLMALRSAQARRRKAA